MIFRLSRGNRYYYNSSATSCAEDQGVDHSTSMSGAETNPSIGVLSTSTSGHYQDACSGCSADETIQYHTRSNTRDFQDESIGTSSTK